MANPMTPRGYAKLKEELARLKGMRPGNAEAIAAARAHGDLSENADYDAARDKAAFTEARIRQYESQLASAEVIDPLSLSDLERVVFGTTVEIEDCDSGDRKRLSIYGSEEQDPGQGWISWESPLARALIGKSVGDVAEIVLRGAKREYEIMGISVEYQSD